MHGVIRSVTAGVFGALAILLPSAGGASAAPGSSDPAGPERQIIHIEEINLCNGEIIPMDLRLLGVGRINVLDTLHGTAVGDQGNVYVLNEQGIQTFPRSVFRYSIRDVVVSKGPEVNAISQFKISDGGVVTFTLKCVG